MGFDVSPKYARLASAALRANSLAGSGSIGAGNDGFEPRIFVNFPSRRADLGARSFGFFLAGFDGEIVGTPSISFEARTKQDLNASNPRSNGFSNTRLFGIHPEFPENSRLWGLVPKPYQTLMKPARCDKALTFFFAPRVGYGMLTFAQNGAEAPVPYRMYVATQHSPTPSRLGTISDIFHQSYFYPFLESSPLHSRNDSISSEADCRTSSGDIVFV